jgi:hypothetical protein
LDRIGRPDPNERELLDESVRELEYQKRGKNIVAAITAATREARQ